MMLAVFQNQAHRLPELILEHYSANGCGALREAVYAWNDLPCFGSRAHIFAAALEQHVSGSYVLPVPALLPAIEGVTRDFLATLGLTERVNWTRVHGLIRLSLRGSEYAAAIPFARTLMRVVYASFDPSCDIGNAVLNRHAILHGADTGYGSEENSLRCFLALDSLHFVFANLLNRRSGAELRADYERALGRLPKQRAARRVTSRDMVVSARTL